MGFNIIIFMVASTYWYYTGYALPAFFGYAFVMVFVYDEELYFISYILGILTLISIIFFFFKDGGVSLGHGISILYMIVILLKSKIIFDNNDYVSFD